MHQYSKATKRMSTISFSNRSNSLRTQVVEVPVGLIDGNPERPGRSLEVLLGKLRQRHDGLACFDLSTSSC